VYQMHITVEFGKNATIKLKALAYLVMIESSECMCIYIYIALLLLTEVVFECQVLN
jgi:hypothetical protein